MLLVVLAALLLLLLALARGASAWAQAARRRRWRGAGERRYMDLAMRRMESVRSSFVARRELATVSVV